MKELSQQTREALAAKILDDSVKLQIREVCKFNDRKWVACIGSLVGIVNSVDIGQCELRIAPNTIKVEACELPKHTDRIGSFYASSFRNNYAVSANNVEILYNTLDEARRVAGFLNKTFGVE